MLVDFHCKRFPYNVIALICDHIRDTALLWPGQFLCLPYDDWFEDLVCHFLFLPPRPMLWIKQLVMCARSRSSYIFSESILIQVSFVFQITFMICINIQDILGATFETMTSSDGWNRERDLSFCWVVPLMPKGQRKTTQVWDNFYNLTYQCIRYELQHVYSIYLW